MVYVVICMHPADGDGGGPNDVTHIFSSEEKAQAFLNVDKRHHVCYDYALDCPERHEELIQ
jgi:hypothetical protein